MIALADLESMFKNMRSETKWNVDGDMLWGYFFFDPSPEKLNSLAEELKKTGYHFVNVHQTDDKSSYVLHVENVETHTPATLDKRNHELTALAEKYGVECYDGMDVGPVVVTKK